ncbi:uncharacterized protein FIBRA_07672 [Fibroporia radiculosa]|uniref:F-box domain-containing protein n=1 Tax=Fibroporia radiculosa TaxID=599839 RepID=J4I139_9APHY|nr:uncharacterized protein FIBRA_07672 [Fibroporia radiculosa]CCM05452.1 predicted protein [Fibroporia radiculosa]
MNILALNDDVLSLITSLLPCPDALRFSLTSRAIRPLATRHALTTIAPASPHQAQRAYAYLLADVPHRLRWLRRLDVRMAAFGVNAEYAVASGDYAALPLLADVLTRAPQIRHLSVACAEHVVMAEPRGTSNAEGGG